MFLPKVLQNFKVSPKCTSWPRELNQKRFSFFPRNIQYRARIKRPHSVFSALCDFLRFFFHQRALFYFSGVLRQNGRWKIPKGSPFQFSFRHCETFFSKKNFSSKGSQLTNSLTLWSPFAIFEPLIWHRLVADLFPLVGQCSSIQEPGKRNKIHRSEIAKQSSWELVFATMRVSVNTPHTPHIRWGKILEVFLDI